MGHRRAGPGAATDCRILNHYGPPRQRSDRVSTPSTTKPLNTPAATVPIGWPLANTACYVLDEDGRWSPRESRRAARRGRRRAHAATSVARTSRRSGSSPTRSREDGCTRPATSSGGSRTDRSSSSVVVTTRSRFAASASSPPRSRRRYGRTRMSRRRSWSRPKSRAASTARGLPGELEQGRAGHAAPRTSLTWSRSS